MLSQKALFAVFGILTVGLMGCSGPQEGSLVGDKLNVGDCPTNSCAQGVADPAETKLVLTSPISQALQKGSSLGEVSGDCYTSLYTQNFLELSLRNQSNQALNVANHLPPGFVARCENGKFYIPVNLLNMGAGLFTLDAQLVVVDATGAQIRPAFKTISAGIIVQP